MDRIGKRGDNQMWVCTHRLLKAPNCLDLFSGLAGENHGKTDWSSFGIITTVKFVFDLVITRPGDQVLRNIQYHQWGSKAATIRIIMTAINSAARGKGPKMYTIQEIVKELGHENRKDILKINCEKCECYQDWISMDIQQILVESRAPWAPDGGNDWPGSSIRAADYFNAFRANHYGMFSKEVNVRGGGTSFEFGTSSCTQTFGGGMLEIPQRQQNCHRSLYRALPFLSHRQHPTESSPVNVCTSRRLC
jgi:hypothetical protein